MTTADKPGPNEPQRARGPETETAQHERGTGAEPSRTDAWLLAFASALADLAPSSTAAGLSRAETGTILHLARDVAHGTERRFAPLAAYLTGRFVTARVQQGATVEEALAEVQAAAARLLEQLG